MFIKYLYSILYHRFSYLLLHNRPPQNFVTKSNHHHFLLVIVLQLGGILSLPNISLLSGAVWLGLKIRHDFAHMSDASDRPIERGVGLAWSLCTHSFSLLRNLTHISLERSWKPTEPKLNKLGSLRPRSGPGTVSALPHSVGQSYSQGQPRF